MAGSGIKQKQEGKNAFELIEEAFHLLRLAPGAALAHYYLGSLPFVLGLLFFWSDMSRSAFAEQRLAAGAFALALLFVWMKCWQAVFAQDLLARLCGEPAPRWRWRRLARVALAQAILQPSGLFLFPIGLVILLPFGWIYAFYQNVTALGGGEELTVKSLFKKAWEQSKLWPLQNHSVLFLFKVFGLFVLLNLVTAVMAVPFLLDTLFGIETAFSQSPLAMLNTTFFAAVFSLTYLCVDPVLKAVYVLRCFQGESLSTGQDLKTELKMFLPVARAASVLIVCFGLFNGTGLAAAATDVSAPGRGSPVTEREIQRVSAPELDRAIEDVIHQREYIWRMQREKNAAGGNKSTLTAFIDGIFETIGGWVKAAGRWLRNVVNSLEKYFRRSGSPGPGTDWSGALRGLFLLLITALVVTMLLLLLRMWRGRHRARAEELTAEAILPAPDLTDENVGADELPEDGWVKLAHEFLGQGEFRLALRAFYLATLAHLADRNLISIAKFKSNHDYERELRRRAHALPEVLHTFSQNVSVFDRVWYGLHEVNQEIVNRFANNVEKIKAGG